MIKSLHLASFNGNIGDIANHIGFWNLFRKYVSDNVNITRLEIREYYKSWGKRKFDDSFVDMVNSFDLLVIGGGNFFDVKWEYSRTGTTLDIPQEILEKIHIPIVFNGLGLDYNPDAGLERVRSRFESFIGHLTQNNDKYIVSVRNDDSINILNHYFSGELLDNVIQVPDGGFFTSAKDYFHPEISDDKINIAVNIAKDRIVDRWGSDKNYEEYCKEFTKFINVLFSKNNNIRIVFVPHIPSDLQAISDVICRVKDYYCRKNITIAPYLNGVSTPGQYLVDLYRKTDIAIGMRYHSNICSIAMNTPTIGIVTLNKHIELYKNIGMDDRLFNVNKISFAEDLCKKVLTTLSNKELFSAQNVSLVNRLEQQSIPYYRKIAELILKR